MLLTTIEMWERKNIRNFQQNTNVPQQRSYTNIRQSSSIEFKASHRTLSSNSIYSETNIKKPREQNEKKNHRNKSERAKNLSKQNNLETLNLKKKPFMFHIQYNTLRVFFFVIILSWITLWNLTRKEDRRGEYGGREGGGGIWINITRTPFLRVWFYEIPSVRQIDHIAVFLFLFFVFLQTYVPAVAAFFFSFRLIELIHIDEHNSLNELLSFVFVSRKYRKKTKL